MIQNPQVYRPAGSVGLAFFDNKKPCYLKKYTWYKQIESYGKQIIHGFSKPTIINPEKYCERFIKKFKRYFKCV